MQRKIDLGCSSSCSSQNACEWRHGQAYLHMNACKADQPMQLPSERWWPCPWECNLPSSSSTACVNMCCQVARASPKWMWSDPTGTTMSRCSRNRNKQPLPPQWWQVVLWPEASGNTADPVTQPSVAAILTPAPQQWGCIQVSRPPPATVTLMNPIPLEVVHPVPQYNPGTEVLLVHRTAASNSTESQWRSTSPRWPEPE